VVTEKTGFRRDFGNLGREKKPCWEMDGFAMAWVSRLNLGWFLFLVGDMASAAVTAVS
jgi:hypothetical protein